MAFLSGFWSRWSGAGKSKALLAPQLTPAKPSRDRRSSGPARASSEFRFPASEKLLNSGGDERLFGIIRAFAPSQPAQSYAQFAGRSALLQQVIGAIEEHRNHLVIFGGRGTGKTSLALALLSLAEQAGYHCAYVSCTHDSTVASIFRTSLAGLSIRYDQHFDPRESEIDPSLGFDSLIPEGDIQPQQLVDVLSRIRGTRLILVIDEFDRNENGSLSRDLTEVMKVVSDRDIPVQVVIVGVGDVVDQLVGEHSSIARVLYAVRMSPMSDGEIQDTLALASKMASIELSQEVTKAIIEMSHGRPYTARLIGLKAAKVALLRGSRSVTLDDLGVGANELLGYFNLAGLSSAQQIIEASPSHIALVSAMLRCKRDASDCFTAMDVCDALLRDAPTPEALKEVEQALARLSVEDGGFLRAAPHAGGVRYRFSDPRIELCMSIVCARWTGRRSAAEAVEAKAEA